MTQITTQGGMITFRDTLTGFTKQIGTNQLWLQFKADTVNFLRVSIPTDGSDGTPFWSTRASKLTINGKTYTIEQLKNGEGLDALFSAVGFTIQIVDELPDVGDPSTIYLVYDNETGTYTEYLWIAQEQVWEALGSVADVDLGNYYTKTQVDQMLAGKADNSSLATVATTGSYNDLVDKPVIPTIPTNVSAFNNDAGYLTEHQSLDNYYNKTQTDNLLAGKQTTLIPGANITIENNVISATGGGGGGDMSNYYTKTETDNLLDGKADTSALNNKQDRLISGTNIKTINNQSLLGSGNITIEGGSDITVDDELSPTSENPVQNKVIYQTIGDIESALHTINYNSANEAIVIN